MSPKTLLFVVDLFSSYNFDWGPIGKPMDIQDLKYSSDIIILYTPLLFSHCNWFLMSIIVF